MACPEFGEVAARELTICSAVTRRCACGHSPEGIADIRAGREDRGMDIGVLLPTGKAQWGADGDPRELVAFALRAESWVSPHSSSTTP